MFTTSWSSPSPHGFHTVHPTNKNEPKLVMLSTKTAKIKHRNAKTTTNKSSRNKAQSNKTVKTPPVVQRSGRNGGGFNGSVNGRGLPTGPNRAKGSHKTKKGPSKSNVWKPVARIPPTKFALFYNRGDLPVAVAHGAKRKVLWKERIPLLDFSLYLPLFFEGLREVREPYTFIAEAGVRDLLQHGHEKVLPVVPQLILPIKSALNTKNKFVIRKTLYSLQLLVKCAPLVGEALVPYFRQLLPMLNVILLLETRCHAEFDKTGKKLDNLVDLVNDTLSILDKFGGEDAYVNIKYMIPTYENYQRD